LTIKEEVADVVVVVVEAAAGVVVVGVVVVGVFGAGAAGAAGGGAGSAAIVVVSVTVPVARLDAKTGGLLLRALLPLLLLLLLVLLLDAAAAAFLPALRFSTVANRFVLMGAMMIVLCWSLISVSFDVVVVLIVPADMCLSSTRYQRYDTTVRRMLSHTLPFGRQDVKRRRRRRLLVCLPMPTVAVFFQSLIDAYRQTSRCKMHSSTKKTP
jgi:hypothetical protein